MDKTTQAPEAPQPDAELKITATHRAPKAQEARKTQQQAKNAAMAEASRQIREQAAAAAADDPPEEAAPPEPIEDVESIEVKLLDGRTVEFGPPKGVSLTMRILMSLPECASSPALERTARVLMSIRSIDGRKPREIANALDLRRIGNEVGDVGIDELFFWYQKYWGNLRISDAQVLKKNLRG